MVHGVRLGFSARVVAVGRLRGCAAPRCVTQVGKGLQEEGAKGVKIKSESPNQNQLYIASDDS